MNLKRQPPLGPNCPDDFDGCLDSHAAAVSCAFNMFGSLLAVGCNDGRIVIWDFMSRVIGRTIYAHVHPVSSLSWTRRGDKILAGSTDYTISIWNILTGNLENYLCFASPVLKVQFHPRNAYKYLVCLKNHAAIMISDKKHYEDVPTENGQSDINVIATFDHRGRHILTGNGKGIILVIRTHTLNLIASFQIASTIFNNVKILDIKFEQKGNYMLVNSSDKIIRLFSLKVVLNSGIKGKPHYILKLRDCVNKLGWQNCCFSSDGEYICASSVHQIYIWEKLNGNLMKILHDTKSEFLKELVWHPSKTTILSISCGKVSIWTQTVFTEHWDGYYSDFKVLDENVTYEERESEFDGDDEDRSVILQLDVDENDSNEDEIVDVLSLPDGAQGDQVALQFLASTVIVEESEDEN